MAPNQVADDYHVVASVGGEPQLRALLALACALAGDRGGRVTILTVTPNGRRPAWLEVGQGPEHTTALPKECSGVPVSVEVRGGTDAASEILDWVHDEEPDLLLLGWRGRRGRGGYLLGRTLDPVVQRAPCDVVVLRAEWSTAREAVAGIERVLVPAAGGPNAELAIDLALGLSPDVKVTAINIARAVQGQVALSIARERLAKILDPWLDEPRVEGKVVQAQTIIQGILKEAGKGYDLVMIGASQESYIDRVLFGNIPQTVAAGSPVPSIVVRRVTPAVRVSSLVRLAGWRIFEILPTLDLHEQIEVYKTIRDGAQPSMDFYIMIGLSAAIAAFGLLQNSAAVIIGAMLVAPLMLAIFGISLGVVRGDLRLLRRSATATLQGAILAVLVSLLLTFVASEQPFPSEIMSRTEPNLLDLGIALASG
ncbi:MAG: universal stress protein, partial [Anaerolineae bacterium]